MQALKAQIEARLMATEDYRALRALEEAISKLVAEDDAPSFKPDSIIQDPNRPIDSRFYRRDANPISQADAAALVFNEKKVPLSVNALIPLVQEKGAKLGGADPSINLSSSLSRDERFQAIRLKGKPLWWLAGVKVPSLQDVLKFGSQDAEEAI